MKYPAFSIFLCVINCIVAVADDCVINNGVNPWTDRDFIIKGIPEQYLKDQSVPKQSFNQRKLIVPAETKNALIGIWEGASKIYIDKLELKQTGHKVKLLNPNGGTVLTYDILIFPRPPENTLFDKAGAGIMLLALNIDEAANKEDTQVKSYKILEREQTFTAQEWPIMPGERTVKMYVREPDNGVNKNTGFMLLLHNWGGSYKQTAEWCDTLANLYNVVAISVDYLQSNEVKLSPGIPYDHGYLQAMDCIRAIYVVRKKLLDAGVVFNENRYYAAGGSGGGNVSLMCNKFAPHTFACTLDMCGMPGLTAEIAFGKGGLNAGYSNDPASQSFLSADMSEIRNPGNPVHLKIQYAANPGNKVIIVHGIDDKSCSAADKIQIFHNLVSAGFKPDGHFLTEWSVLNQPGVQTTNHTIGNRLTVIQSFGNDYFLPAPKGRLAASTCDKNDFQRGGKISYPTSGGNYIIDYSQDMPIIKFEKSVSDTHGK